MGQPNQPTTDDKSTTDKDASKTTTDPVNDPNATDKDGGKDDGKGKQDDDAAALKSALKKERQRADALEKEKRDAELSKLPELEQAKARLSELERENAKLKTENMRRQVGMELGLPWNLARRIDGDDEDAMREDAKDLLKSYKADNKSVVKDDKDNKRPPNDAKRNGSAGKLSMNDLLRAAAGKG